jgi:hypothetical protein
MGYDIGFFKYNPLVVLMKNASYFFVIQNFNGFGHRNDIWLIYGCKVRVSFGSLNNT